MAMPGTTPCAERQGGSSLVGILVVLVVLGGMAALAVSSLTTGVTTGVGSGRDPVGVGGFGGVLGTESGPSGSGGRASGPLGGAAASACKADFTAVQAAVAAKQGRDGQPAGSVGQLVSEGWLSQPPANRGYQVELEVLDGVPTGAILVNGSRGMEVCDRL